MRLSAQVFVHIAVCQQQGGRYQNGDFHFYRAEPIPLSFNTPLPVSAIHAENGAYRDSAFAHTVVNLFAYPSCYLYFRLISKLKPVNV
jgi:hypothetical protein